MAEMVKITQKFTFPKDWRPVLTTAYDVKIKGKHLWLKRLLWWGLQKLGCVSSHWDREMLCESMITDPDKVSRAVLAETQEQFQRMYGKKAATVYIGLEDFADLMSDPTVMRMGVFSFAAPARRSTALLTTETSGYEAFGMTIVTVPHMRGILVV